MLTVCKIIYIVCPCSSPFLALQAVWELAESGAETGNGNLAFFADRNLLYHHYPAGGLSPALYIITINYQQFTGLEVSQTSGAGTPANQKPVSRSRDVFRPIRGQLGSWTSGGGGGVIDIVTEYSGF